MTKEEFLALKKHVRVKYTGKNVDVLDRLNRFKNVAAKKKGYIVKYTNEDTKEDSSRYYGGYGKPRDPEGFTLTVWNGPRLTNLDPTDWVVTDDTRADLQRKREQAELAYAKARINDYLGKYISGGEFKDLRGAIDSMLGNIPLTSKFEILSGLTTEQRAWYHIIQMDKDELNKEVMKLAEE